ncbi:hypothetical protein N0V82_008782 [Gnomoniopsis sp. IMI 355080]|nr:hypothetical protein N0V82_008782 [Gnomoniopsis sp. IMI 355080]
MRVSCQCGSVNFDTPQSKPLALYHCHCTQCQKQSASAFGTSAIFPAEGIFPLSPDLQSKLRVWTRPTKEGRTTDGYFCNICGVRVLHRKRNADGSETSNVSVKGGLVDGLDWSQGEHIFTDTAVFPIPPGAIRWEGTPASFGKEKSSETPNE